MNSVLMCGIQKSGNMWLRFVMLNYFNILLNNATKTLTWRNITHLHGTESREQKCILKNHPIIYQTHLNYKQRSNFFDRIDKMVYIYRNPFDTMISFHEYKSKHKTLENATKYYLKLWIRHIKTTRHLADVILNYDDLRINPILFKDAIELTGVKVDMDILKRTIELSSFDNIKKIINNTKKMKNKNHCRDGRTGQYKEIMNDSLINYIKNECIKAGIKI